MGRFAGVFPAAQIPPQVWTNVGETSPRPHACVVCGCGQAGGRRSSILAAAPRPPRGFFWQRRVSTACEAHLSAKRPPPQAQARLPGAHVDEGRPRDPQAPARQGPRPPLGLASPATKLASVKRANRLSRSRDFDAVHRRGRSVSSRFLVLYWLPQDEPTEPRIGFAVPRAAGGAVERNRIKRRLREVWRARLERVPDGPRLRADRPPGPRRGGRGERLRLARRARRRAARQSGALAA